MNDDTRTERVFARAEEISRDALASSGGDTHAAIVALVGSDAVADLLILDYGSEVLALGHSAYFKADREIES